MPRILSSFALKSSATLLASICALASIVPVACTPDELDNKLPPGGAGGFDPGETTGMFGSSSGGPGVGGQGGTGGSEPMCDDSLKKCEHTFTYADGGESSVEVRGDWDGPSTWVAGAPMTKSGGVWSATVDVPWSGEVQYKLVLNGDTWITDPANPDTISDGNGNTNSLLKGTMCEDFTCGAPPVLGYDWRDAVMYFVFVDRFLDGNPGNNGAATGAEPDAEYKGGDYAGVIQKIEAGYFNDLGVNTLWITVPMQNPNNKEIGADGKYYSAYHGYWPSDLTQTEERFGSMTDLKNLVDAAHAKGLKVLVDYAMNHVHKSAAVYSQHADWFWPNSNGNGGNCVCGEGCSWDGDQGKRCWFRDYLPDFNFQNAEARNYSVDNAIWWIQQTGIDGFRLDAVKHIEDSWLLDLRSRVTKDIESVSGQHFYMVGETFTGDKGLIKYYVDPVTKLDGQFDFPLRVALARTVLMRKAPMSELNDFLASNDTYYGSGVMSTFIGNHDMPRPIHFAEDSPLWSNEWDDGKNIAWNNKPGLPGGTSAFERLANAFTVLYTIKGIPLVYYGDEIGLPGAGDPDNRRMMQWSGYSAGQNLLLGHLKKLGAIRADHEALRKGSRQTIGVTNDTLAYKMSTGADTVYVVVNRGDSQQSVGGLPGGQMTNLLNDQMVSGPSVNVPARSSMILVQ
ncbi:MAG: alpha-amylase family glycosyl hydrolase [Polyangiaceae bacterium]